MSERTLLKYLLGIQGWEVEPDGIEVADKYIRIRIREQQGAGYHCSGCGEGFLYGYDHLPERTVRDAPAFDKPCYLVFSAARVDCPSCGIRVQRLDWVDPSSRYTLRLERMVARLCELLPVLDVARYLSMDKNTVYRLDKKWLELKQDYYEEKPVTHLGVDEIAIRKGHTYATVFYDLKRKEVIGLVKTRRERAVGGFFRRWGRENFRRVEAVCMDLWKAYHNSVKRHCPQADIVFDKFHLYKYTSDALEAVRRSQQQYGKGKELIKGSRWWWLKRADKLRRKQRYSLSEIMKVNKPLQKAYLLKEDFGNLYACTSILEADTFLKDWVKRCRRSNLCEFRKLANRIEKWKMGILAYFDHRITNGAAEGINNKIKVLKRRCYGFRDEAYFFLKIQDMTGLYPKLEDIPYPLK